MLDYEALQATDRPVGIDAQQVVDKSALDNIAALARKQWELERDIAATKQTLANMEQQLYQVSHKDIPTALDEVGVTAFTLANGYKVEVRETLYASVPKKNKPQCAQWLQAHDLGDLVEVTVLLRWGLGEAGTAREVADALHAQGLNPTLAEDMNTARIKAAVKELLEDGVDVPLDMFGAYIDRASKLIAPK